MTAKNPPINKSSGLTGFLGQMLSVSSRAAEAVLAKLDPLPVQDKSDPALTPENRDALMMIESIAPVVTSLSIPAYPARNGMPFNPARIQLIGQMGSRMLPADLWKELVDGGWVTPSGVLTPQYHRVIDSEIFADA